MAVTLDFRVDEEAVAEDRRHDPARADPAVLQTTYFRFPVRFAVDDVELFGTPRGPWLPQPLLGFAVGLAGSLDDVRSRGSATCTIDDAGTLRLDLRGERVHMTSSFNRVEAETGINELDAAVKIFRQRVADALRRLVPEVTTHPSWSTWFPPR